LQEAWSIQEKNMHSRHLFDLEERFLEGGSSDS